MKIQNIKTEVKKACTPAHLKKAAAIAALIGIISAGCAYYHQQQAQAHSIAEKQARSEMIAAQASQRGIVLIDEAQVQSIAAKAIGKSESDLNFHTIQLEMKKHDDQHDKHRDDKHERKQDRREHNREDLPAAPNGPRAPMDNAAVQQDFRPIYKVKCYAGKVEYELRIDAVTGEVLTSKVDVDDDIF